MARQLHLSQKALTLIADCIFDGLTDEETALLSGVSVKFIQRARAGDECPAIKRATLQRKRGYIALIRDGDDRSNRWQRVAWFLERRYPTEFSKPEVQLSLGASTVTNNTLVITAEAARALQARASTVEAEVEKLVAGKRGKEGDKFSASSGPNPTASTDDKSSASTNGKDDASTVKPVKETASKPSRSASKRKR